MTTTKYSPKANSTEAYRIMQEMAINSNLTIQELAEANECTCGYQLLKKIEKEIETGGQQ